MQRALTLVLFATSLAAVGCSSSNGTTCTVSNGAGWLGDDASTGDPCGAAGSGDDGGSGNGEAGSGSRSDASGGDGTGSGHGSGGTGTGDASGGSSGSSGSVYCSMSSGDPDFCLCEHIAADSGVGAGGSCSAGSLRDHGACCADPGWPSSGSCQCASFLCEVNQGGGRDCFFNGASGILGTPTTSASGAACCLRGSGICSCYDANNAGSCDGFQKVSSCSFGVVAPCTDLTTQGEMPVASCR